MISDTRPKVLLFQRWVRTQKPANKSLNLVALSLRLVRRGCRNLHLVDQGHWLSSLRVLPDGLNCRCMSNKLKMAGWQERDPVRR